MRNTFFDASPYAAGLDNVYEASQTHFTYLDDGEIAGGGAWMAQAGENLHVTIQSPHPARTYVAHYFYHKANATWRHHLKNGATPIPYGTHVHANLQAVQRKAIEFAWPPAAVVIVDAAARKTWKTDKKARKKAAEQAKKSRGKESDLLDEMFPSKGASPGTLRPVRFVPPPAGRITLTYVNALIGQKDLPSLEFIFKSDDWKLDKWDSEAWSRFMDWNATGM